MDTNNNDFGQTNNVNGLETQNITGQNVVDIPGIPTVDAPVLEPQVADIPIAQDIPVVQNIQVPTEPVYGVEAQATDIPVNQGIQTPVIENNGYVPSNVENNINVNTIDPQSIFGEYSTIEDEYNTVTQPVADESINDFDQTNLNKSINNHSDVVSNYNLINNTNIDDSESVSSYEEQITNSQDINFYTQTPNKVSLDYQKELENPQPVANNFDNTADNINYNIPNNGYDNQYNDGYSNAYQDNQVYDNYQNNNVGIAPAYDNNYDNYQDQGYNNGYDNSYNNYQDQGYNDYQNQGYDNYNQGYDTSYDNGYGGYQDNSGYDASYNDGYESADNVIPPAKPQGNELFSDGTKHPKTIGPEAFQNKMKKQIRPYNFLLLILYVIIIAVLGYFGYNLWLDKNSFYVSKEKMNLVTDSTYQEKVYYKKKLDSVENYEWSSENTAIATVDSKGNIAGVKAGDTIIKVTSKKTKKSFDIEVKVLDVDIKQFTVSPSEKVIYIGNTYTITPKINGQTSLTIDTEFKSEDEGIATVNQEGVITPVKKGHTNITISIPGTKWSANMSIVIKEK